MTNLYTINEAIENIQQGKIASAKFFLNKFLLTNPKNFEANYYFGIINALEKNFSNALHYFFRAYALDKNSFQLNFNIARAFDELKEYEKSVEFYQIALQINKEFAEGWSNLGLAYHELGLFDKAIISYDKALLLRPNYVDAISNKGLAFLEQANYAASIVEFDKAISLDKNFYSAYLNKSLVLLTLGKFQDGWNLYRYRWKAGRINTKHYSCVELLTQGLQNIKNKNLLVWHEQGMGDTVQFSRYIDRLEKIGVNVTFQVQRPLLNFFKKRYKYHVVEKINNISEFDLQVPVLDLPYCFNTNLENIPTIALAEKTDPRIIEFRRKQLGISDEKPNIGLAISGNPNQHDNLLRSIPLDYLTPITEFANIYLIQTHLLERDKKVLKKNKVITHVGKYLNNMEDTAEIVECMDLILSVCTSLIHISGALNKKSYLMLRTSADWRWLSNTNETPWYPSVSIFRQKEINNWEKLAKDVIVEIKNYLNIRKKT